MKNEETLATSSSHRGRGPGFVICHVPRRHISKPIQIDAARARDVAEGQIQWRKPHMRGKIRVPGSACLRGLDELLDGRAMAGLIARKGCAEVIRVGLEGAYERQHIFQGKPRS